MSLSNSTAYCERCALDSLLRITAADYVLPEVEYVLPEPVEYVLPEVDYSALFRAFDCGHHG